MKTFKISKLDNFGRGITKVDDKITFVSNALLDEEVEINISNSKKSYNEAEVINYINSNNNRQTPKCMYYGSCGGCNIMHMNYKEQLEFKKNKVKEALEKFANVIINDIDIIPSDEYHYRNKITLQVKDKRIGFYRDKSLDIVEIDTCLIADEKINEVVKLLNEINLDGINQIIIRVANNKELMVVLRTFKKIDVDIYIDKLKDVVVSLYLEENNKNILLYGNKYIIETIANYKFCISPSSFFQVNTRQAEKMYELVRDYIGKEEFVLDLYCGTGTIAIYLSSTCKRVLGIEINKDAVKDAKRNLKLNDIDNVTFKSGEVEELSKETRDVSAIVVDPPRSGLTKKVIANLKEINAKKIVYVSCDPVTLARDLKELSDMYKVEKVTALDMFPNTYHVETIVLLKRL